MSKFYAVQAKDILGNRRFWSDSYPTVKLATQAAKDLKREHPHWNVKVLKELPRPSGHEFGNHWEFFREIRA